MSPRPTDITPTLHERLLNWGRERPLVQFQGVRLLVTTAWLDNPDFVAACLTDVDVRHTGIDWAALRDFADAHQEADPDAVRALQLAYSLAKPSFGERTPADRGWRRG